jgi:glycosyltransferase involved in cell wall biosynthesis
VGAALKPHVSIIIPWRDRAELAKTLEANLRFIAEWQAELLIVNFGGDSQWLDGIVDQHDTRLRVIEVRVDRFNKSRALNIGIHFARAEYVLLLDADVILTDFDLHLAMARVDGGAWVGLKKIVESASAEKRSGRIAQFANYFELVLSDQRVVRVETKRTYFSDGARSCPGILFLRRQDLLDIGGFNSALVGWGWEDIDLHVRLGLILGRESSEMGAGLHLSHGDENRFFLGSSPAENNHRNRQICMGLYDAGMFEGTYEQDTAAFTYYSTGRA